MPVTASGATVIVNSPASEKPQLEMEKLRLEISELHHKQAVRWVNEPITTTVLTLLIGGVFVTWLTASRSKKNKRYEQSVRTVESVARDLNSVFTPMFRFIRRGNRENVVATDEQIRDRALILAGLKRKVPRLFEKRLGVYVNSTAFLPHLGKEFADEYGKLCQELGAIQAQLEDLPSNNPAQNLAQIQSVRASFNNRSELASPQRRPLRQPFKELDDWIENIWSRSNDLLASTLKNLLR